MSPALWKEELLGKDLYLSNHELLEFLLQGDSLRASSGQSTCISKIAIRGKNIQNEIS